MERRSLRPSTKPKISDYVEELEQRAKTIAGKSDIVRGLIRRNQADMRLSQYDERMANYICVRSRQLEEEQRALDIEIGAVKEESKVLNAFQDDVLVFQQRVRQLFISLQGNGDVDPHQKLDSLSKTRRKWLKRLKALNTKATELLNRKLEIKYLTKQYQVVRGTVSKLKNRILEFIETFKQSMDNVDLVREALNQLRALEEFYRDRV